MPKLSLIEAEARRLVGRLSEPRRRAEQDALIELCETHWQEIRGPQPAAPLAQALWATPPVLADLLVDLYAHGDGRPAEILDGMKPVRALALLVLAEIERGDADGVHAAHEAMMVFDTPQAARIHAAHVAAALRAGPEAPDGLRRFARAPLAKALAVIVSHTGRHDLKAVLETIRLLAAQPVVSDRHADEGLEGLREALKGAGVRFLGIDEDGVRFELHGHAHKPASVKRVADALAEIRQKRLA